jgi:U3 small nucleolar ribonucleoprotein protein IMP3
MLRKLKYHEKKLLKKTDFLDWRKENNLRESAIVAKYGLSDREEYLKVCTIGGSAAQSLTCCCSTTRW